MGAGQLDSQYLHTTLQPQAIPLAEKIIELEDEHAEINQVSRTAKIVKKTHNLTLFEAKNGKDLGTKQSFY